MRAISKFQLILVGVLAVGLLVSIVAVKLYQDNRSKASVDASQELEAGIRTGSVSVGNDPSASGGQYVKFGLSL